MFQFQNRKEMEALSEALEKLINGEAPEIEGISQDTLPSKVRSQILRLGEIMKAKDQALGKEKEEIRFLTEGLIKMARLESRIIQIRKEAQDLQETLLECILQVKKEAEEKHIEIRVRDWGRGIEEGEENLVFGRFYRGKNVSGEKGFGLGLYLTREILHQHGGFLRLKRQEPGLSVSIYLPEE